MNVQTKERVQAPKTVGPNLAELTMRERAELAWAKEAEQEDQKAKRAAKNLALHIFGSAPIEFDDFIPEKYAQKYGASPRHLVTFEVEGLEFTYRPATKELPERLSLIDICPHCGEGIRYLAGIAKLADLGRFYALNDPAMPDERCGLCDDDDDDDDEVPEA